MKPIILRKPKFMRSDAVMNTYLNIAESIVKSLDDPNLTTEQQYDLHKMLSECFDKGSKAGGFFRTKDFIKWFKYVTD